MIVIHWATDSPANKVFWPHKENDAIMNRWIGACYYWGEEKRDDDVRSWTWKFPVLEHTVNKAHPITKGVPEKFKLHDEYYFNFFTDGPKSRNPLSERVVPIHSSPAAHSHKQQNDKTKWKVQPSYWAYERDDKGRSVAMTSAHMYHTWANPHFFKTFMNSVFWAAGKDIPENGVDIKTPTVEELLSISDKVKIDPKAQHFK